MKKLLAILLVLVMVLSVFAGCGENNVPTTTDPGTTAPDNNENKEPENPTTNDIVILYTNDVHTYIDGTLSYDVIGGLKKELAKKYGLVLLVDAGDHAQGTAYGSMDKGKTIVSLMNGAGYDLATLGNHEFDYGMDGCMDIIEFANYTYVSCNFYNEKDGVAGDTVLDSFKIFEKGNEKIAIIGVTTPETFTKSTPAYFQDENGNYIYGIAGGEDGNGLYTAVQNAVNAAKEAGATKVIALGHLGVDEASAPWTSKETIANVSGLDIFIDGHSHTTMEGELVKDKDGKNVLLTQTGEYFGSIGIMIIDAETGNVSTDLIGYKDLISTSFDPDGNLIEEVVGHQIFSDLYTGHSWPINSDVKTELNNWMNSVDTQLGEAIGSTTVKFDNYDAEGNRLVRKEETNTGDFAADALYYLFDNMGLDVDVAIMNGGGVRNKGIEPGEFSYKTAKTIHTFGNVACLQTITGQQLLDALEWGARSVGSSECGGFLQVSGITYEIDSTWESSVQMDDKGVWTGAPTGGYRVKNVMVYNKETNAYEPLNLEAKYNLAGYNYTLRDLGDGFNMFSGAVNVLDYVMEDYMVLANYVKAFENGEVGATNSPLLAKYVNMLLDYSTVNGSGRITIN